MNHTEFKNTNLSGNAFRKGLPMLVTAAVMFTAVFVMIAKL